MSLTYAQQVWLEANPEFSTVGPPRPVQFSEWGNLSAQGVYERLDDQPRKAIQVGNGSVGVGRVESGEQSK